MDPRAYPRALSFGKSSSSISSPRPPVSSSSRGISCLIIPPPRPPSSSSRRPFDEICYWGMWDFTLEEGPCTGKRLQEISPAQHRQKRLCSRPPAAVATSDVSLIWASLPGDLVLLIAWRLLASNFLDYIRFRAVCTRWRSGTVCPRGRGVVDHRFHPRRWMMLPEGHGLYPGHGKLRGFVRFFNLDMGTFVRVQIPLFRNHCALDTVDGLLVLQRDEDTAIRLLHPFTGDIVDLPPLATLHPQVYQGLIGASSEKHRWFCLRSVFASSCSISAAGVVTVMLALNRMSCVAFATSTDQQWTLSSWKISGFSQLSSFRGKLYVVAKEPRRDADLQFFQIDSPLQDGTMSGSLLPPPKLLTTCSKDKLSWPIYLVDSGSEILVVGYNKHSGPRILVLKLADLILERFIPLKSIGDSAIFLDSSALCVCAKALPTVLDDTVVHKYEGRVEQFSLSTATISQALDDGDVDGAATSPCSLICHIFTCCSNIYWNKGLIHSMKNYFHTLKWRVKGKFRNGA